MKVLVDTSVWSEALRRKDNSIKSEETFIYHLVTNDEGIVLTGIILQEILSGIKSNKLFQDIQNTLRDFNFVEPRIEDYIYAAELKNNLMKKGINAGSIDFLIASIAINNDLYLATYDNDFDNISKFSDLRVISLEKYKNMKTS
jgi:predicted nucleic acid-binding protein